MDADREYHTSQSYPDRVQTVRVLVAPSASREPLLVLSHRFVLTSMNNSTADRCHKAVPHATTRVFELTRAYRLTLSLRM